MGTATCSSKISGHPDPIFHAELLGPEYAKIAARLKFHCSLTAAFKGLLVNEECVVFRGHVFYKFEGKRWVALVQ